MTLSAHLAVALVRGLLLGPAAWLFTVGVVGLQRLLRSELSGLLQVDNPDAYILRSALFIGFAVTLVCWAVL